MTRNYNRARAIAALVVCLFLLAPVSVSAAPLTIKVRVTGLFSPDREADLRAILKQWPDCTLTSLDFDRAEAVFRFDPAQLFPQTKPEQIIARLDEKLRAASNSTFGVKPPSTTPRDKLKRIEIPVAGLDCKACCLAAYEIVANIDGVEQATASFKEGRITALIDPQRTDRAKIEAVLKQRGVTLAQP